MAEIKSEYVLPSGIKIRVHEVKNGQVRYTGPWLSTFPEWKDEAEFLAWVAPSP